MRPSLAILSSLWHYSNNKVPDISFPGSQEINVINNKHLVKKKEEEMANENKAEMKVEVKKGQDEIMVNNNGKNLKANKYKKYELLKQQMWKE